MNLDNKITKTKNKINTCKSINHSKRKALSNRLKNLLARQERKKREKIYKLAKSVNHISKFKKIINFILKK